ncbi:MAG: hypothetical protein HY465_03135 [Deltaproteobacteria bacterium]|nr:hypothetical protein [Deltaproteobacteria bacterium]
MTTPTTEHCKIEGCKRPYRSKGYCNVHFRKWRRGELEAKPRYKTCGEENCRKPMVRNGQCQEHYDAWDASRKAAAATPVAETAKPASEEPSAKE